MVLLKLKKFKKEDFAMFHPGGALGKKLILRVSELMHTEDALPLVTPDTPMQEALFVITSKRLGVTGVMSDDGSLLGVITDGDLRRALEKGKDIMKLTAGELMTGMPKRIRRDDLAAKALQRMEEHSITSLFVFDDESSAKPVGIVHLHDLLKAGLA